jgi:hypothetical protein
LAEHAAAIVPDVGSHVAPDATYVSKQVLHLLEVISPGVPQ